MVADYGVSRSVVREATKALDFLGIISAVPRRGMILDTFDFDRVSEYFGFHFAFSDYPRDKLLKARMVIETGTLVYTIEEMNRDPALYGRLRGLADAAPSPPRRGRSTVDRLRHRLSPGAGRGQRHHALGLVLRPAPGLLQQVSAAAARPDGQRRGKDRQIVESLRAGELNPGHRLVAVARERPPGPKRGKPTP